MIKRVSVAVIILVVISIQAHAQYRLYHRELSDKNQSVSNKSKSKFKVSKFFNFQTPNTKMQINGLQILSVNRQGTGMNDVYFVDKEGIGNYRTVQTTSPLNAYFNNQPKYDSFNPHGALTFEYAVGTGAFWLLAGLFKK